MSQSKSLNPSARFVVRDDFEEHIHNPICACGHLISDHVSAGCFSKATNTPDPRGYCPCMMTPLEITLDALEALVRVKVANELYRLSDEIGPYRNTLRERAEAIRNG